MTYVHLGPTDVALAAVLLVVPAALDVALRLDLTRALAVAAARTVAQLTLVGFVLRRVFDASGPWLVVALVLGMSGLAAREALQRSQRKMAGTTALAWSALLAGVTLSVGTASALVIRADPWWTPQYVVPLSGMVLGNGLTGVSLAVDRLLSDLVAGRAAVEQRQALGLSVWAATRPIVAAALRAGMTPILNAMAVAGLVSLPGMMTGQILGGADPMDAVAYQIVVMFLIASATATTTTLLCLGLWRRLEDPRQRVRWERLR